MTKRSFTVSFTRTSCSSVLLFACPSVCLLAVVARSRAHFLTSLNFTEKESLYIGKRIFLLNFAKLLFPFLLLLFLLFHVFPLFAFMDTFLDASTHLNERVCPSVGPSVGPSVTRFFFRIRENACFRLPRSLGGRGWRGEEARSEDEGTGGGEGGADGGGRI